MAIKRKIREKQIEEEEAEIKKRAKLENTLTFLPSANRAIKRKISEKQVEKEEMEIRKRAKLEDRHSLLPPANMAVKRKILEKQVEEEEMEIKKRKKLEDRHTLLPPANMTIKRKILEKQVEEEEVEIKKRARMEDRLSNLPEDLQLHILSLLNIKESVRTSVLSKTWVSLWTRNPVLELYSFTNNNLYDFDKFVYTALLARDQSAKLDRFIFTRRGTTSAKILQTVFNYAFSHGVNQLEANISTSRNHTWPLPVGPNTSFDSLTTLKLQSETTITCPFLGPRFKNLTCLYLQSILITDVEPFSGFPLLEKLTLLECDITTEGKTLSIHAPNLSDLSISGHGSLKCCELITPKLRFFRYRGYDFPLIRTHDEGLPVLDMVAIDFNGGHNQMHVKKTFDDLFSLLCAFPNAKSLTLFWATVEILSFFQNELLVKKRSPPFQNLKCMKLDFRSFLYQNLHRPSDSFQLPSDVKDYLFLNSPNPKVTTMYPQYRKVCNCKNVDDYVVVSSDIF